MAALPQPIDADARLESMTSALLEVTSVFLIQQNELQEVRERLQKELARVAQIQDALTQAAQKHQDAVSRARREQGSTCQPCCIGPLLARSHALPFIINAQRVMHLLFTRSSSRPSKPRRCYPLFKATRVSRWRMRRRLRKHSPSSDK
jgi:hypothetical protein